MRLGPNDLPGIWGLIPSIAPGGSGRLRLLNKDVAPADRASELLDRFVCARRDSVGGLPARAGGRHKGPGKGLTGLARLKSPSINRPMTGQRRSRRRAG